MSLCLVCTWKSRKRKNLSLGEHLPLGVDYSLVKVMGIFKSERLVGNEQFA